MHSSGFSRGNAVYCCAFQSLVGLQTLYVWWFRPRQDHPRAILSPSGFTQIALVQILERNWLLIMLIVLVDVLGWSRIQQCVCPYRRISVTSAHCRFTRALSSTVPKVPLHEAQLPSPDIPLPLVCWFGQNHCSQRGVDFPNQKLDKSPIYISHKPLTLLASSSHFGPA